MDARSRTSTVALSPQPWVLALCSLSFLDLQKRLKDGKLTAKAVLACYQAQASHAHSRVNCLTEFLPEANQVAEARIMPSNRARRCFVPQASLFAL